MLSNRESQTIPPVSSPNIGSRLLGTFVGGWTGAAAGVRRAFQFAEKADIIGPFIILGTGIVTIPFHGIKGAYTGATQGLKASVKYPTIVENKRHGSEIQKHLEH